MVSQNDPDIPATLLSKGAYDYLLLQAHALAKKAMLSLKGLEDRYPEAFPPEVVEAVHRYQAEPLEGVPARDEQERRRHPRSTTWGSKLIVTLAEEPAEGWEVPELDRTWNSVGFLSDRPLPVGAVVTVWQATPADAGPPLRAEVKSCRPEGDAWVIGCEFLPMPDQTQSV